MPGTPLPVLDAETERKLAAGLYNEVWRLMEIESRTAEQTDELIRENPSVGTFRRSSSAINSPRGSPSPINTSA